MIELIEDLTEETFQEFLLSNKGKMWVHETENYDYHYFLPTLLSVKSAATGVGRFVRQC